MDFGADSLHESERLVVGLLKPPVAGCSDSRMLARTSEDVSSTGEHAPRLGTFRCIRGHSVECISESWSPCPRHG